MSIRLETHPVNPQSRYIAQAARAIADGALLVIPTDAGYSLTWGIDATAAEQRVQRLRALDMRHPFTLLCDTISQIGSLAKLDDQAFRIIKSLTPGPITFILPAGSELPRRLKQTKRRAIGCRIPNNAVTRALLETVGSPLLTTSLVLPDEPLDNHEADAVAESLLRHVDLMLDAGDCPPGPTSVLDLTGDAPTVTRQGFYPLELD
ncbi:L-threonylcarbamoyladenylate synthase [Denitratimonas sp. CY0512]|uniref:L-threonylcarbamoyladenylate synthase n=1 Tax=Denitratimonas sp. CY0512 TaxID=3131940 RepID=UPI0030950A08